LSNSKLFQNTKTYWWTYSAFAFAALTAVYALREDLLHGFYSGLLGLFIAVVIYTLWKIDRRFGKIPKPDRTAENLIAILGIILWLIWMSISQIILIAQDEVKQPDYNAAIEQSEFGGKHTRK
jgi:hypothetical protein